MILTDEHADTVKIGLNIECIYSDTPVLPDAARGDYSAIIVTETKEQLDEGLIWWGCIYCGGYVLIDSQRQTREKCQCGARRINHRGSSGWRRGEEIAWYI